MPSFFSIVVVLFVISFLVQWTVFFCVRKYILARPKLIIHWPLITFLLLSVFANLIIAFFLIEASLAGLDSLLRQSLCVIYFFYLEVCLALFLFFLALGGFGVAFTLVEAGYRAGRYMFSVFGQEVDSRDSVARSNDKAAVDQRPFEDDSVSSMSRRAFMRYAASSGTFAIVGLGSYGLTQAYEPPKVDVIEVSDPALYGLTRPIDVLQIADLHYGMFYTRSQFKALVERLNSMEADAVVITGDIFHSRSTPVGSTVTLLRELRNRRWGNFVVLGNHEFYAGVQRSVKAIQDGGLRLLRNEWVTFEEDSVKFHIGGIDDLEVNWLKGEEILFFNEFIKKRPQDPGFLLLLSHRPAVFPLAVKENIHLTLSGHTHGGQFAVPIPGSSRPWSLAGYVSPYTLGLYESGRSRMYVNRGVGVTYIPTRINCPPEIAVIRLMPPGKAGERNYVSKTEDIRHGKASSEL